MCGPSLHLKKKHFQEFGEKQKNDQKSWGRAKVKNFTWL